MKKCLLLVIIILMSCSRSTKIKEAIQYNNTAITWSNKNPDSAAFYFDKAIAIDSTYLLPYQNKVNLFITLGQYEKALNALEHLSKKVTNSETTKMKGLLNDLLHNTVLAKTNYNQAIALIDEEVKRDNDFVKYKKLFIKGTLYLLLDSNRTEGLNMIEKYGSKSKIRDSKKDSIVRFQHEKEALLTILISP